MAWVKVFLGMTGVCLAFLVPFVIFFAIVVVKKMAPTPRVVAFGIGITTCIGVLVLLPMDPRSRQYSWLTIAGIAFFLGLLGFLGPLLVSHLQSVLGLPQSDKLTKALLSRSDSRVVKSHDDVEENTIKKSTKDGSINK
jgi:hypothetical protein